MASVTDQCTVGKEGGMTLTDTVPDTDHTETRMRWNPCVRGTTQSRFLKVKCNPPERHFRQLLTSLHTGPITTHQTFETSHRVTEA